MKFKSKYFFSFFFLLFLQSFTYVHVLPGIRKSYYSFIHDHFELTCTCLHISQSMKACTVLFQNRDIWLCWKISSTVPLFKKISIFGERDICVSTLWTKDQCSIHSHTHTHTQSCGGDINGVCGCWLSCESVWGGREDRCRRLMSAGIGRIVRHLMNECKLATVELIPPPSRQDWKFSPLCDLQVWIIFRFRPV